MMVWPPQRSGWQAECFGAFGHAVLALKASQAAVVLRHIHAAARSDTRTSCFTGVLFCFLLPKPPQVHLRCSTHYLDPLLGAAGHAWCGCMLTVGRPASASVPRGCGGFKSPTGFRPGLRHLLCKGASVGPTRSSQHCCLRMLSCLCGKLTTGPLSHKKTLSSRLHGLPL